MNTRHKIVAYWGEGRQINSPVQPNPSAGVIFRGRSNRLGGTRTQTTTTTTTSTEQETDQQQNQNQNEGNGIAFRGRSYRLNG